MSENAGESALSKSAWTYSSALQALTDVQAGALAPAQWSTVRVGALGAQHVGLPPAPAASVKLVSGRVVVLAGPQYSALQAVLGWDLAAGRRSPFAADDFALAATPAGRPFIGVRWIAAVIEVGDVTYERYQEVRTAHDAELAAGRTPRGAWERALAALRTGGEVRTGRETPQHGSVPVPPALELAWTNLGFRLGLAPATANHYRSVLRRVFERMGGMPSDPVHLGRVLRSIAERHTYCAAAPTAWRAFAKAAAVDGIDLMVPADTGVAA
jgi:hypothetical protein